MTQCFCDAIPQIDNRTAVLILQHVGERDHAFNTARIVKRALNNCELIADHNQRFASRELPLRDDAGLLFPADSSRTLEEVPRSEHPRQLVIVDGTWHQARTVVRDVPQLQSLTCFRLSPSAPGQYRIRREPNPQSLSTLEATVAALQAIEPETDGLGQLLAAFDQMVTTQLQHPAGHAAWRKKQTGSQPRFLPQGLLQPASKLVVAYGEAARRKSRRHSEEPVPLSWHAERLGTGERFGCCLTPAAPLSEVELRHMQRSQEDFASGWSRNEFRNQWTAFVRPDDVLIVYHQRTLRLLNVIETPAPRGPRGLVLKSIYGQWQSNFRTLEDLIEVEGVTLPQQSYPHRALQRLAMATALVHRLRERQTG